VPRHGPRYHEGEVAHVHHVFARVPVFLVSVTLLAAATRPQAQEPRFRGGANLVRLDVYASVDGQALTDLTVDDFEVLEDNTPQSVSSFEFVQARGVVPDAARVESNTVAEMRSRAAQSDGRLFVLFLDTGNVQLRGSFRAASPVAAALDRLVGTDDLLGVMTPDMSAGNMTLSPRTTPIGEMLRTNWTWGERGRSVSNDPREEELRRCYPDDVSDRLIARRREQKALRALSDLTEHLEELRDERTFVLLLTEGWILPGPDDQLAQPVPMPPASGGRGASGPDPVGVTPAGRVGSTAEQRGGATPTCERERSLVALSDLAMEFRLLTQRANRANVSFYPVDARGLVVFDQEAIASTRQNPSLMADGARLDRRRQAMRELAAETDGTVVVDSALDVALPRLMTDIGSYYLLGYVSTNTKLDGRYRRLTVRVKRPGVTVRARP
jgi:VWFA-related protein